MDRVAKIKEKNIIAAVAVSMLLAGMVIGFILSPKTTTVTVTTTQFSVVTVTSVTEVPVKHKPMPFSASAQLACIIVNMTQPVEGCPEPNIKAVALTLMFTELGVENSYIKPTGLTVIAPGLARNATLEGTPVDALGRIVVRPGRYDAKVHAMIPVVDLRSFVNWMRDVGKIAVVIEVFDEKNQPIQTVQIEDIVVYGGVWSLEVLG